ncbi:hypothetical protein CEXT_781531 [Caerostris extrusa]|uniref:Uncharacterized protein n=1 Tax=Caerostris extrusa TaxID=172846 RepID=A0AAV4NII9_CAEEX|nr:hypothetical protein CEXT_781531 [Caerostris extrusa]
MLRSPHSNRGARLSLTLVHIKLRSSPQVQRRNLSNSKGPDVSSSSATIATCFGNNSCLNSYTHTLYRLVPTEAYRLPIPKIPDPHQYSTHTDTLHCAQIFESRVAFIKLQCNRDWSKQRTLLFQLIYALLLNLLGKYSDSIFTKRILGLLEWGHENHSL